MWQRIRGVVLVCLLFTSGFAGTMVEASSLAEYRWQNRLIIVFTEADSEDHRWLMRWADRHHCALSERDLIVFAITAESVGRLPQHQSSASAETHSGSSHKPRDSEILDAAALEFLRNQRRFPSASTEVLLIGKDGGIKSQSKLISEIDELFGLVDAMPMRRQEASRQKDNC